MFMDKVTTTRDAAEDVLRESRLLDDPPSSLLALLPWEEDGQVTTADRMLPLFQSGVLGERHGTPQPVDPVWVYLRT